MEALDRFFNVFALPLLIFLSLSLLLLSYGIKQGTLASFDKFLLTWFYTIRTPFLDQFFATITWLGSLWILLPLYLIVILFQWHPQMASEKLFLIGFLGTILMTYLIKYGFERSRPRFFNTLYELPIDPSYPSAHTAQIVSFSILVSWIIYQNFPTFAFSLTIFLVSIAILVALSRIYLQVHYPSDVLGGLFIALFWTILAIYLGYKGKLG